jgi:hypothetical protein
MAMSILSCENKFKNKGLVHEFKHEQPRGSQCHGVGFCLRNEWYRKLDKPMFARF